MNRRLILFGISLVLLAAGVLLYRYSNTSESASSDTLAAPGRRAVDSTEGSAKSPDNHRNVVDPEARNRRQELADLKRAWLAIGPGNDRIEERTLLSEESVAALLTSQELIELIEFLDRQNIYHEIKTKVERAFVSGRADKARRLLLALPDEKSEYSGTNYRENWSALAGFWFSEERALEAFCDALACEKCAQEARFGHYKAIATDEPVVAFQSALAEFNRNVASSSRGGILYDLVRKLPEAVDFQQIERSLPEVDPENRLSPINMARTVLFEKWAAAAPADAANYVLENFTRLSPSLITPIATAVFTDNQDSGAAWVELFPEGEYRDAAAHAAVDHFAFDDPERAREFLPLMSDTAREQGERRIAKIEEERRTRQKETGSAGP